MRSLIAKFVANQTIDDDDDGDDQYCLPDPSWNFTDTCNYIQDTDACGGGGYLEWATFVYCCEDPVAKWFIVAAGCLFLILMFMMLQSSADDFFSPNLSTIVHHLKMSESVAGVTFLAFGNGAPDIFGAIASVLSSPKPKADLALGGLIGAAIFVTLIVHASVVLTTPFKAAFWSTMRDLIFLLVTACLILSFFLFYDEIQLWQPLTFLGVYVVYVTVVFTAEYYKKRKRAQNAQSNIQSTAISRRPTIIPTIKVFDEEGERKESVRPELNPMYGTEVRRRSTLTPYISDTVDHEGEDLVVLHNKVYHRDSLRSRNETMRSSQQSEAQQIGALYQLLSFFAVDFGDEEDPSTFDKIKAYIFWPIVTVLKLTIPLSEAPWSKPLVIFHAIIVPQCILFNTQFLLFVPIDGGPGLWAYAPVISVLLIVFILCTTTMNEEPRFYRTIYSYLGFISSVVWIYCISAEVVDVVDMLGVVSGIDQAVLGLTLIAWANSIGDLVADIAVAKQGFPRMAVAGSIGGPLFNMLIGFGLPFTIAKLKGDTVPIALDGINLIMITFLFISILFTMVNVLIFRAHLSRLYGFILCGLYVAFLVFIILSETGVLVWLP